jgi:predicted dehydrogenase
LETLRGGLVGFGFILSRGHLPAYLERAERGELEIVAVADVSPERRALAELTLPGARIYRDHEAMLRAEAGNLDFVDIATPPAYHVEIARAALEAGAHVLCEKPLATNPADAARLLGQAMKRQRVIFPCHNYKHAPVVKAIRQEIDSGALGSINGLTLSTFRNIHARGVSEWQTDWRRERRHSGGGIAMDDCSLTFDLTFDWFGEYPSAFTAKTANRSGGRWDTEDNFSAVLTFPSGLATVQLTWTAGIRKVVYAVQGERGAITVNDDHLERAVLEGEGDGNGHGPFKWKSDSRQISSHWMDASHVRWFDSMFDEFVEAIRAGDYVPKEARDAWRCNQVIASAYCSAEDGCRELPLQLCTPWD